MYIFGGFVRVGGTLDNGKPWEGLRILLAPYRDGNVPSRVMVAKASCTDSMLDFCKSIDVGTIICVQCDLNGKIIHADIA